MSLSLFSCTDKNTLEKIKTNHKITVLTRNNAHCYYSYRDNPCGFEYDLAKSFSEYLGVELNVVTPAWAEMEGLLENGTGHFIAASISISESREKHLDFSDDYLTIQQKVILHTANHRINRVEDLNGLTIHVRRGTSYEARLKELNAQGMSILIRLYDDIPTEEFIRMVSEGEIDITVADSNIALLNRRYYPDIKIAFPLDEPQPVGWAVKKGEKILLQEINSFFDQIREDGTFAKIYEQYHADLDLFDYVDIKKYHIRLRTRLPKYLHVIRKAAGKHAFDWRLIAAMIYQESHFNPKAKSYTGVAGLMQLTNPTALEMGVTDRLDPEQSIMGGVGYLKKLFERYKKVDNPDRFLISLAGYNVGHGHILDAQKIAREKGLDPHKWASLEEILPLLRFPKYYRKAARGYCRGTEPVRYVKRIMMYYDILKKIEVSEERLFDE